MREMLVLLRGAIFMFAAALPIHCIAAQAVQSGGDNPDAKPPLTKVDVRIMQRAREILDSPSRWNRADTRICPAGVKTFSIYCALEKATEEVTGKFQHRGAAMQEARLVIDEIAPNRKNYNHRLMGYNNDPATTFADLQKFFRLLEDRMTSSYEHNPRLHNEEAQNRSSRIQSCDPYLGSLGNFCTQIDLSSSAGIGFIADQPKAHQPGGLTQRPR
jgi:hypothetical protein